VGEVEVRSRESVLGRRTLAGSGSGENLPGLLLMRGTMPPRSCVKAASPRSAEDAGLDSREVRVLGDLIGTRTAQRGVRSRDWEGGGGAGAAGGEGSVRACVMERRGGECM
jgi:hypothetical protein